MKLAAFLIPLTLIVLGVFLLIGCFSIPATRQLQPNFKPRPEFAIGAESDKPVRLGYTRIDDAFIELNHQVQANTGSDWVDLRRAAMRSPWIILNNWTVSPDRRQFAVVYAIRTSTTFNCFPQAVVDSQSQYLVLNVDDGGIVTGARTADLPPFGPVAIGTWLEVFDQPTRRKLQAAGVFPSDEQIELARRMLGKRFYMTQPATSANTQATENLP